MQVNVGILLGVGDACSYEEGEDATAILGMQVTDWGSLCIGQRVEVHIGIYFGDLAIMQLCVSTIDTFVLALLTPICQHY